MTDREADESMGDKVVAHDTEQKRLAVAAAIKRRIARDGIERVLADMLINPVLTRYELLIDREPGVK